MTERALSRRPQEVRSRALVSGSRGLESRCFGPEPWVAGEAPTSIPSRGPFGTRPELDSQRERRMIF